VTDDNINRLKLTFEQAEGVAPLPRQLELQEVSPELRAQLWQYIHDSIVSAMKSGEYGLYVGGSWQSILRSMHVDHYHRMIDDFVSDWGVHKKLLRRVFQDGSYTAVFGFLQWILRHRTQPSHNFSSEIDARLARCRSAYRVVNGNTIVPVSSPEEKQTLDRAFADLASTEFNGARQHLKLAAERATAGDWAGSVRESISAVESTVKCIDPDAKELRPALAALEKQGTVHGSLRQGFLNLYGYTSDEKGVRHSLLKDDAAKVDQTEALFMLGACAAFVSYLINKGRGSGLISK
jgi:hypothetical protein